MNNQDDKLLPLYKFRDPDHVPLLACMTLDSSED